MSFAFVSAVLLFSSFRGKYVSCLNALMCFAPVLFWMANILLHHFYSTLEVLSCFVVVCWIVDNVRLEKREALIVFETSSIDFDCFLFSQMWHTFVVMSTCVNCHSVTGDSKMGVLGHLWLCVLYWLWLAVVWRLENSSLCNYEANIVFYPSWEDCCWYNCPTRYTEAAGDQRANRGYERILVVN